MKILVRSLVGSFLLLVCVTSIAAAAPAISTLSPVSGAAGASITIVGTAFGATKGTSTVKFNGVTATTTSWSATSIVAAVPSGATTGNVVVTVSGAASNGKSFTVVAGPSITTLSPSTGAVGAIVTIAGANFGSPQGTGSVTFNGTAATPSAWSATSITVPVPAGATTGNVIIRASGVNSAGKPFTVAAAPSITTLTPTTGAVGAIVTIAGANFGSPQGTGSVTFNGTAATPSAWSATSITVPVPTGATTGNVIVRASGVNSAGKPFTVAAAPSITTLTPTTGAVGAIVTMAGANFGSPQGTGSVTFNGTAATPSAWSATSITVPVPAGATTGNVIVRASGVNSAGKPFTVVGAPSITTLSPTTGSVGTVVTIAGANFGSPQGTGTVSFNGTATTPSAWSAASITVPVPAGATTGNVIVRASGVNSAGKPFTVAAGPIITQLSPAQGVSGTSVTITGTNFGSTKGTSTVKFNGVIATTTSWGATSIAASVPPGATTGNVVVTKNSIPSAGVLFTVPTLTSLTVAPPLIVAPINSTQQFRATGRYSDSIDRDITATVTWSSSDQNVAAIATGGLATVLVADGTTSIGATLGAFSSGATLNAAPDRFRRVGSLTTHREYHASALLGDGRVLVTGGQNGQGVVSNTAEIYDPATGQFQATGNMVRRRHAHTATTLIDGRVLILGGIAYNPDEFQQSAEIYDPATGAFSLAGWMAQPRFFHNAALLTDGRVLVTGGYTGTSPNLSAEVYDPATNAFVVTTGAPLIARSQDSLTLLADGRVLVAGGTDDNGYATAQTELYDPATDAFTAGPTLTQPRDMHPASRLADGRVLLTGGGSGCPTACTAELYDPVAGTSTATGTPSVARGAHSSTTLDDGTVLVVGGQGNGFDTATAELFEPATQTFRAAGAMFTTRWGHSATKLPDGNVLIVGGSGPMASMSAELYLATPIAPTSLSVSPSAATMAVGESRGFTLVDHLGLARTDGQWSSSNPLIASVDPDTGSVTALAAGTVTVSATIGAIVADATVAVVAAGPLVNGTIRWTMAPAPGFVTTQVLQSTTPDAQSPALFVINAGASQTQVQGIGRDGQLMWQTSLPAQAGNFVPNKSGGLLVTLHNGCDGIHPMRLVSIHGPTGIWAWEFVGATLCGSETPRVAVRSDGAVAVTTPGNLTGFPQFMVLEGNTGSSIAVPSIPTSTFTSFNGQQVPGISRVGPVMADRDGTLHLLYEKRLVGYPPAVVNTGIWLMSRRIDGTSTTTQLNSTTDNTNLFPANIIPDGTGGLIATWIDSPVVPPGNPPAQSTFRAARITAGGSIANYDLPLVPPVDLPDQPGSALPVYPDLTLGSNGRAFVAYEAAIAAFDVASGAPIWQHAELTGSMRMIVADASQGLIAAHTVSGADTVMRFDASGGATGEAVSGSGIAYTEGLGWLGAGAGAQLFQGRFVETSLAGWSTPTQQNTKSSNTLIKVLDGNKNAPEQTTIRLSIESARDLLLADVSQTNHTCSAWFNTGFPQPGVTSAADFINLALLSPNQFAHAVFRRGGSDTDGEHIAAFVGDKNNDEARTPVDGVADTIIHFNRSGAFFNRNFTFNAYFPVRPHKEGPWDGNTPRARLVIVLHELAHLLQDNTTAPSVGTVPGFVKDGGDDSSGLSEQNNNLVLKYCKVMIERVQ